MAPQDRPPTKKGFASEVAFPNCNPHSEVLNLIAEPKTRHPSQHSSAAFADLPRFGNLSTITCAALRETDLCWCDSVAQGSSDPNGPGHSAGCIRPSKTEVWSQMLLIFCEPHRIIETWHFYQWMFRIKTEELFSTKDQFGLRIKFGTKDLIYNGHAERSILRSTETVASFESTTLYCEQAQAIRIFSTGNSTMTFSGLCWPLWQTIDLQVGSKKVTFELPAALYLIVDLLISCLRLLPSYWKTPQDNMVVGSFGVESWGCNSFTFVFRPAHPVLFNIIRIYNNLLTLWVRSCGVPMQFPIQITSWWKDPATCQTIENHQYGLMGPKHSTYGSIWLILMVNNR